MRAAPWWRSKKERRALASHTNPPKVYFGGKDCARKPTWMLWVLVWFHEATLAWVHEKINEAIRNEMAVASNNFISASEFLHRNKRDAHTYLGDTYERLSRALGLQALNESLRHLANYEEHR